MKQIYLLFASILILASANTAAAVLIKEAYEIPYQINESDRIIIGTVSDIQPFSYHTIVTIEVAEWLKNPLPTKLITVGTDIGTIDTGIESDEVTFTANESMILMLKDVNISENMFRVVIGEPGKHPVSDKDAVLKELAAREQAQREGNSEDQIVEYPTNPVEFILPTSDRGYDMDGDGLFDYLIVEMNARTSEPGRYYLGGQLYVPLGTHEENNTTGKIGFQIRIIDIVHTAVYLNESVQTVAVNFEGGRIRNNEMNGPYEVSISVSNETWGFGHAFDCTTDEYDYTQFEPPAALLSGPVRSKAVAIGLAREKAQELGIEVGEVNHTEILIERSHEIWALDFKGEEFDERFVIHDEEDIEHRTMNGTWKGIPMNGVPFIGAAGTAVVLVCAALLIRGGHMA